MACGGGSLGPVTSTCACLVANNAVQNRQVDSCRKVHGTPVIFGVVLGCTAHSVHDKEQQKRMDATNETPLLGGQDRNNSVVFPALQELLQLAHSQHTDKQIEVKLMFRPG